MFDKKEPEIRTNRLLLRRWRESDLAPFAAMSADPRVMEYFPKTLTRPESDALVERLEKHFELSGFGIWALEDIAGGKFIGTAGLNIPKFKASFTPCVEIGWRLAFSCWGRGFAAEAAKAALNFGFTKLDLREILAFTVPANLRSQAVMDRIGMKRDPSGDFDHPNLPAGHALSRHILYRIKREEFHA